MIKYNLSFPTSVYSALENNGNLYVGGSNWIRREVPYSKKIAINSNGLIYILNKKLKIIRKLYFPSMVYSIIKLNGKRLFIGCKSEKKSFNIINQKGDILKHKNDKNGKGVYNAVFDYKRNEIICTTRSGKIEFIDANNLKIKSKIQISSLKTRLWSLKINNKKGIIYTGDYEGNLYLINREKLKYKKFDLKDLYYKDKRLVKGFSPSLWGLELAGNKIIIGTRWGDILLLNENFKLEKRISIGEDISCLEKLNDKTIFVGTRYGKLLELNLNSYKTSKIIEIKPFLQKENAIWGMARSKDGVLVCFADGNVCKVK